MTRTIRANHPAAGKVGIASLFAIERHCPDLLEPERSRPAGPLACLAIVVVLAAPVTGCRKQPDPQPATAKMTNTATLLSPKVYGNDTEMNAAMEKARNTFETKFLPILLEDRRRPLPLYSNIIVKAHFSGLGWPSPEEMMWLGFVGFDGTNITGVLLNVPENVTNLAAGQTLSFRLDGLADWALEKGGKLTGGFTERILHSRLNEAERRIYDANHSYTFE